MLISEVLISQNGEQSENLTRWLCCSFCICWRSLANMLQSLCYLAAAYRKAFWCLFFFFFFLILQRSPHVAWNINVKLNRFSLYMHLSSLSNTNTATVLYVTYLGWICIESHTESIQKKKTFLMFYLGINCFCNLCFKAAEHSSQLRCLRLE